MNSFNFQEWKAHVSNDPLKAANHFFEMLSTISPQVQKAALVSLQSKESILEQFQLASQEMDNPLSGIPYLVKDLFDVKGIPTRAGSSFLEEVIPVPSESSFLCKKLQDQRAVFCGKTQLNEFAYGLSGENLHYGNCPHPFVEQSLSGGSSSGSAWAVAKGLVPFALGTDTGGSIRVPAAFCGIYGMRIPDNDCSKQGVFPLSPSFDTAGWFTTTPIDMQTANTALIDSPRSLKQSKNHRFLYITDYAESCSPDLRRGYDQLANALGGKCDSESSAWFSHSINGCSAAYTLLQSKEAFEVHRSWFDTMRAHYDPIVWDRINYGRNHSAFELENAHKKRTEITKTFEDIFSHYDAILLPATPAPSPPKDNLTLEFRQRLLQLNSPASMAQLPVLTIPVPLANRLSGGMQVIFPHLNHSVVNEVLERSLSYHQA